MGNVVFFFIQNISKHFFLVDSGQNWQTTGAEIIGSCQLWKKWGFLTKIMGYSPGLWKNSHFGDYIKLSFYCITGLVFHFENQKTFNISCRFCTKPNYEKKSNFLPKIMGSGTRDEPLRMSAWECPLAYVPFPRKRECHPHCVNFMDKLMEIWNITILSFGFPRSTKNLIWLFVVISGSICLVITRLA